VRRQLTIYQLVGSPECDFPPGANNERSLAEQVQFHPRADAYFSHIVYVQTNILSVKHNYLLQSVTWLMYFQENS
jgi:hypothetical protein